MSRLLPPLVAALLLALACSREPASLEDWFPDRPQEQRVFETLEDGAQRGFHTVRTVSVAPDEGRGKALFFLDARHQDLLGDYHLVLFENRLQLRLSDLACTLDVFRHPPVPGEGWVAGPGTLARVESVGRVETPAGDFDGAAHVVYEIGPELFARLGIVAPAESLRVEAWFAPFEGPVRIRAAGWYEERLVERR